MSAYRYDVAFSFLDRDEALVRTLVERLGPSVTTFFAPERQRELAGTEGVDSLTSAYRRESRTVAIIYRPDWGATRWTAVEQSAIKTRGLETMSWDFVTLVLVDPKSRTPDWFPLTRFWSDYQRLGEDGLVAVLQERIIRAGGTAPAEDPVSIAERLARDSQRASWRRSFLHSDRGVQAAAKSLDELYSALGVLATKCSANCERYPGDTIVVRLGGKSVTCSWRLQWRNTLEKSDLLVELWKGLTGVRGTHGSLSSVTPTRQRRYAFDAIDETDAGWRLTTERGGRLFSAKSLADELMRMLLGEIERDQRN